MTTVIESMFEGQALWWIALDLVILGITFFVATKIFLIIIGREEASSSRGTTGKVDGGVEPRGGPEAAADRLPSRPTEATLAEIAELEAQWRLE